MTQQITQVMSDIPRLEGKIDGVAKEVGEVKELMARVMTRTEVEAADAKRVSLDTYISDQREVSARLTRLESNPQKFLAWLAVGVSALGVGIAAIVGFLTLLLTGLTAVAGIAVFVLTHYKP